MDGAEVYGWSKSMDRAEVYGWSRSIWMEMKCMDGA